MYSEESKRCFDSVSSQTSLLRKVRQMDQELSEKEEESQEPRKTRNKKPKLIQKPAKKAKFDDNSDYDPDRTDSDEDQNLMGYERELWSLSCSQSLLWWNTFQQGAAGEKKSKKGENGGEILGFWV